MFFGPCVSWILGFDYKIEKQGIMKTIEENHGGNDSSRSSCLDMNCKKNPAWVVSGASMSIYNLLKENEDNKNHIA